MNNHKIKKIPKENIQFQEQKRKIMGSGGVK